MKFFFLKSKTFIFCFLLLLTCLLYFQCLSFDLTNFDDNILLINKPEQTKITSLFTQDAFYSGSRFYRPVLALSFLADAYSPLAQPYSNHLTNILLHALCCFLIFYVLNSFKIKRHIAVVLTGFYAAFPAFVPAVAWIPGRNDTLLSILILISFIYFRKLLQNYKHSYLAVHLLLFLIALFTKETSIVLPVILAIYALLSGEIRQLPNKKRIFIALSWIGLSAIYLYARTHAEIGSASVDVIASIKNLLNLPTVFINSIIPEFMWNYKRDFLFSFTKTFSCLALFYALYLYTAKENKKAFLFGIIWYVIFFAPTFTVTKNIYQFHLMHRTYLPAIGILFALAAFLKNKHLKMDYFKSGIIMILFFYLAITAIFQTCYYKDKYTYWQRAAFELPSNFTANAVCASDYYESKLYGLAEIYAKKTLAIFPKHEDMNAILGYIELRRKNIKPAIEYLKKEVEVNPKNTEAVQFLKTLLQFEKKMPKNKKIELTIL